MDCMIPSHHVKIFSSAINCMNKIGSDIYIEYNILNGLLLHTLNDSKSAYTCFHFNIHYFERCTKPPITTKSRKKKQQKKRPYPVTSTIASDNASNNKNNDADDENDDTDDDDQNEKYLCRIPLRSLTAALRPRKGVISLRIRNEDTTTAMTQSSRSRDGDEASLISYLSFEYNIQSSLSSDDDVILNVIHKVGIANEVSCQRAIISDRDDASVLIASPTVWLRLLEPVIIQKSNEVAIAIRRRRSTTDKDGDPNTIVSSVSATSFHYRTDTTQRNGNGNGNGGVSAIVKSETTIGSDELDKFDFISDRIIADHMPNSVNEEVVLVFCLREAKAMLQFCSIAAASSSNNDNNKPQLSVSLSFHWGGKPLLIETIMTSTDDNDNYYNHDHNQTNTNMNTIPTYTASLVLATLDHHLLTSERTMPEPTTTTRRTSTTTPTTN